MILFLTIDQYQLKIRKCDDEDQKLRIFNRINTLGWVGVGIAGSILITNVGFVMAKYKR